MHNPYRGGTPDVWYSGLGGDLWVEYKWSTNKLLVPDLSPLQSDWLTRRRNEGRIVAVVVGSPLGAAIVPPTKWKTGVKPTMSDGAVADWIKGLCS